MAARPLMTHNRTVSSRAHCCGLAEKRSDYVMRAGASQTKKKSLTVRPRGEGRRKSGQEDVKTISQTGFTLLPEKKQPVKLDWDDRRATVGVRARQPVMLYRQRPY